MSKPKPIDRDPRLELTPEHALSNLFDSDTWPPGLAEADPVEAAQTICRWLRDSGFSIVDQERINADFVEAVFQCGARHG
jgi:hypothetical protein